MMVNSHAAYRFRAPRDAPSRARGGCPEQGRRCVIRCASTHARSGAAGLLDAPPELARIVFLCKRARSLAQGFVGVTSHDADSVDHLSGISALAVGSKQLEAAA